MKICCTGDQKFTDAYLRFSLDLWEKKYCFVSTGKILRGRKLKFMFGVFLPTGGGIEEGGRSSAAKTP